ncbi:hypothetical protein K470DRAFT_264064 [Piedraia hortae CBS 480.64]|uniref:SUN domain-containing protein n=1 Tax=Piedraia hortae CBS 480.64 TaxID=1314780 RepID=A0A6A7C0V6_9PEZI|nr:hypothetical protein K470DRAFT_264064 [Piedraia hortae CBS 480.64]
MSPRNRANTYRRATRASAWDDSEYVLDILPYTTPAKPRGNIRRTRLSPVPGLVREPSPARASIGRAIKREPDNSPGKSSSNLEDSSISFNSASFVQGTPQYRATVQPPESPLSIWGIIKLVVAFIFVVFALLHLTLYPSLSSPNWASPSKKVHVPYAGHIDWSKIRERTLWTSPRYHESNSDCITAVLAGKLVNERLSGVRSEFKKELKLSDLAESAGVTLDRAEKLSGNPTFHNQFRALTERNFFSPALGAHVDIGKTSRPLDTIRPIAALQRWDEPGECWCAQHTKNSGTMIQLSIILGVKIHPEEVIVEHIPATAAMNPLSAPRHLEFWVETTPEMTEEIDDAADARMALEDVQKCISQPPTPLHVCAGTGFYNINAYNWVQRFPLHLDRDVAPSGFSKIVVRATTNWGAPHTCFYRLRMKGIV